jgi:hypothetical protein
MAIEMDTLNPLKFYFLNNDDIEKDKLKPPTGFEYQRKNNKIDTVFFISSIDHSCHHKFVFHLGDNSVEKWYDTYDLDFIKFDNGQKNINYEYNQQLKSNALINLMRKLLESYKTSNKFEGD